MNTMFREPNLLNQIQPTHAEGATRLSVLIVPAMAALLFLGANMPACAATFTVNNMADTVDANPSNGVCADASGNCTLRAAIREANALSGADTITLPAGTYALTIAGAGENAAATGDLDITADLTINGAGATSTIIDGAGLERVFQVLASTVTISDVTIKGGSSYGSGGGIFNGAGTLTINRSTISGNTTTSIPSDPGLGGGISNEGGTLTIASSTVSGNSTGSWGGGIFNNGGPLSLINTTVSGNTSSNDGGGVFILCCASATIDSSTITGNIGAGNAGVGGIWNGNLRNTIVANNQPGNCGGIASLGHNLSSDATCAFTGPGDLNSTNPLLGPLANNGGATATHALLPGSPAIDAVPLASCTVSTDQRGVLRPQGAACDVGAFEAVALPTYSVTYNGNGSTGGTVPIDGNAYVAGAAVTVLSNTGSLVNTGYIFANWNTAPNGGGTDYAGGATFVMGSGNVTLYAQWSTLHIAHYSVTYNGNGNSGGIVPTDSNAYVAGASVTVSGNTGNLVKTSYIFAGWNTAANGNGTGYLGGATFTIGSANVTLYAQWTPGTATACVWAPIGMIAWWPLDETSGTSVADVVGGFDGTAQPGPIGALSGNGPVSSAFWPPPPTFPFPAGMVSTSLFFSGSPRVEVPTDPAIEPGTGDFTIDAWVIYTARGNGSHSNIVQKYSSATAGYFLTIQDVTTTQGTLRFVVNGPSFTPVLTANITPQTWHHVAATLQRGTAPMMALYLDGVLLASDIVGSGGSVSNTLNLLIGGNGAASGEIAVDEVELFNRALTQPEIQSIFNAGSGGKCKCVSPPSGMVSWWPADGNAKDIASGHDGVLHGSNAFPPGVVEGAFSFAAQGDYVEVPNANGLNFGSGADLSIDAWVQTSSSAQIVPIVDKRDLSGGPTGYFVFLYNGHLAFQLGDGTFFNYISSNTSPDLRNGLFHHVAVTVDRSSPTGGNLYVNGVGVLNFNPMNRPGSLTNTQPLFIGKHATDPTNFIGLIDEVEIFNRALAQTEIQDIYRAGSAGKCKPACAVPPPGMVAWYPLDETTGAIVSDVWPYHLDGTPIPGPIGAAGSPSSHPGQVNNALSFNQNHVDVPDHSLLNFFPPGGTGEFSIDAWMWTLGGANQSPFTAVNTVVDKTLVLGSSVAGYALYLYYPPLGAPPQLAFTLNDGTVTVTPPPAIQAPYPLSGGWHLVAVTVARPANLLSATVTLYVDGAPWSATIPVGNTDNSADLWIGKSRVGPLLGALEGGEFAIDEVEIFNGVLTPEDILTIYHAGSEGKCRSRGTRRRAARH